jgi:predicted RND superfamily exporter protein
VSPEVRAQRYVGWVRRHSIAIILGHLIALGCAIYLIAFKLPLFADFSYLLPQDAPAVVDLRKLEGRVKTTDTVLVIVQTTSPAERAQVAAELAAGFRKLPADLVEQVEDDDSEVRAYLREHKYLLAPYDDLVRVRDALDRRIKLAKLEKNPLYIDLEDHKAEKEADKKLLDELRDKRNRMEGKIDKSTTVSKDGRTAMIQVDTAFRATDAGRGRTLLDALVSVRDKVVAAHPGITVGFTGGIITALAEHNAIFKGMVLSSVVTTVLVALVLALYFRSATLLVLLIVTIGIATAVSFGAAAITVGHLNAATAFLGAIIAGNGINYGILLIARYLEERRRAEVDGAVAVAIVGTLRPTAVASLGAAIAYGSLAATSFKGFADFAVIGAIGMMLCWLASFLLLPALLLRWGRTTRIFNGDPVVGGTLVRLLGFRNSTAVCLVAAGIGLAAVVIVGRYVAADPFEYDIKNLRSEGDDAIEARNVMKLSDATFGRGYAGRTFIAADRPEQVPMIVAALDKKNVGVPDADQTIGSIISILNFVPDKQPEKIAVLRQIHDLLNEDALDALSEPDRKDALQLKPPELVTPVDLAMVPKLVRDKLTEKDGKIGYLISIRPADRLDEWNGHDLIRFATAVRRLDLADHETITTSGASVIFADIVDSIERDGPICTTIAAAGLVVMVLLLVGRNRRAVAVLVATASGSLLMVAACALLGLKVNFLDFVALPITLGLGVDYAINVAHRHDSEQIPDPLTTLRTSGSAVFVCSLTTIIGYGSLLVSDNLAIRGFGTASLIGEVACLLTALVLVPALLAVGQHPHRITPSESAAA